MTHRQRKVHVLLWLLFVPLGLLGLWLAVLWRPADAVQQGSLPGQGVVPPAEAEGDRP